MSRRKQVPAEGTKGKPFQKSRPTEFSDGPSESIWDHPEVMSITLEWPRREVVEKAEVPLQGVLPGTEGFLLKKKEK